MTFRNFVMLDAKTWAHLKLLAGSELRSPHDFLRQLVWREWEQQRSAPAGTDPNQPVGGVSPTIPTIYHIRQGK